MNQLSPAELESNLAALNKFGDDASRLDLLLADARAKQKEIALYLVRNTDLSLARIAKEAGLHRLTLTRWCKESNSSRINDTP